jgi:hypothetical protein
MEAGGLWSKASLEISASSHRKQRKAKRAGGVAQVVQHLPTKKRPSPKTKKKKKKYFCSFNP